MWGAQGRGCVLTACMLAACGVLALTGVTPVSAQSTIDLAQTCRQCVNGANCTLENLDECTLRLQGTLEAEFTILPQDPPITISFVTRSKLGYGIPSLYRKVPGTNQLARVTKNVVRDSPGNGEHGGSVYWQSYLSFSPENAGESGTFVFKVNKSETSNHPLLGWVEVFVTNDSKILHPDDAAALTKFFDLCCTASLSSLCSPFADWNTTLCQQAPNKCDADGHLTRLVLPAQRFSCLEPPLSLRKLSRLTVLDLNLAVLAVNMTVLESILQPMTNLQFLALENAQITGAISCTFLVQHTKLNVIDLDNNQLEMTLSNCMFDGSISELYLDNNVGVIGDIPDVLAESNLTMLSLEGTGISGQLPLSLARSRMEFLEVGGTRVNGTLPKLPTTMHYFNATMAPGQGQLTGPFPELGTMPKLFAIEVENNQLSGPLPSLAGCTELVDFRARGNKFSGGLPALPNSLKYLMLSDNSLDGDISAFEPPANLTAFWAANNLLRGFPAALAQHPVLRSLRLGHNQLGGTLPVEWAVPEMFTLELQNNNLTGPIPASLGTQQLILLDLSDNAFSGTLAAFADALTLENTIVFFNVSSNQLSGPLPDALGTLAVFVKGGLLYNGDILDRLLNVSHNQFSGAIPASLIDSVSDVYSSCSCQLVLALSGGANALTCPAVLGELQTSGEVAPALQELWDNNCTLLNGTSVPLSVAVSTTQVIPSPPPGGQISGTPGTPPGAVPPSSSGGLSAGAIAGIILGVLVAVGGLVGFAFFAGYKRQKELPRFASFGPRPDDSMIDAFESADLDQADRAREVKQTEMV